MKILRSLATITLTPFLASAAPQIQVQAQTTEDLLTIVDADTSANGPGQFFGIVSGNQGESIVYVITNTGDSPLRVTLGDSPPRSSSPEFTLTGFPDPTQFRESVIQPEKSRTFRVILRPTNQFPDGIITINSNTELSSERTLTFAVAGRGNLGDAAVFYRPTNSSEREIPSGDTTPTFAKGTNFGDVLVNLPNNDNPSNAFAVKSLPTGTGDSLIISNATITGPDKDEFQLFNLGGTLDQGAEDPFTILFNPSSIGEKIATLTFETNEPGQSPFSVVLRGNGITVPDVLFEGRSASLPFNVVSRNAPSANASNGTAFGEVAVAQSLTNTFRVTNNGDGPLELTGASSAPGFTINSFPTAPLSPGESDEFTITFAPTTPGDLPGSFTVQTNIPGILFYRFPLSGTGTGPGFHLEPQIISQGNWVTINKGNTKSLLGGLASDSAVVSEPTVAGNFRITNTGNRDLVISNRSVIGTGADQFSYQDLDIPLTISGGVTHSFQLNLDPNTPGTFAPDFFIFNNATGPPFDFKIRTRVFAASEIFFEGRPVDGVYSPIESAAPLSSLTNGTAFPELENGQTSVTSFFRFTNTGTNELLFALEDLTGTHADEFQVNDLSSGSLAPGESHEFSITITPTQSSNRVALFNLITTDPQRRLFTFPLLGNTGPSPGPPNRPSLSSLVLIGNDAEFTFSGEAGVSYRLKSSTTLAEGSWVIVPGVADITGTISPQSLQIPNYVDPSESSKFYRIEEVTSP